jgi:hypothetical protein
MLPDQPPTFRPAPPGDNPWWWSLEGADGAVVAVSEEHTDQRFPTQAEAESWVGEVWSDLAEQGVDAVTLHDGDRKVYGPMSLHA